MNRESHSITETAAIAQEIFNTTATPKKKGATVLALFGDLGSGKTTFVQQLGKLLGISQTMQSPTFVIMKSYDISYEHFRRLIHIDMYRLERPEELERLGWEEIVKDQKNLIAIEWAERVEKLLPGDCIKIQFKFIEESTREISYGL
ncbi:MAG TPA: tRNA (adenosine(37)-N6)-threonylcarbamoyltransferase complex ATPase subunit type 1 TsaE [Candidatus Paceibacterota bacterium]